MQSKMQTAISPSLWLPVAQRECTGCCIELHSHMAKSESDTDTDNPYLYGLSQSGNNLYGNTAIRDVCPQRGNNVRAVDKHFF